MQIVVTQSPKCNVYGAALVLAYFKRGNRIYNLTKYKDQFYIHQGFTGGNTSTDFNNIWVIGNNLLDVIAHAKLNEMEQISIKGLKEDSTLVHM